MLCLSETIYEVELYEFEHENVLGIVNNSRHLLENIKYYILWHNVTNSNSIFNLSYFWKNDENDAVVDATVKEFPVSNDNILDKLVFLKSN